MHPSNLSAVRRIGNQQFAVFSLHFAISLKAANIRKKEALSRIFTKAKPSPVSSP